MIISDRLSARAQVDFELKDIPGVMEAVTEKLTRTIVKAGEDAGAFIRPESVWFRKGVNEPELHLGFQVFAMWAPDPMGGVILSGGPHDGAEQSVPRESDGRPPRYLSTPSQGNARMMIAEYVRVGIDSERDRWVYECIGVGPLTMTSELRIGYRLNEIGSGDG